MRRKTRRWQSIGPALIGQAEKNTLYNYVLMPVTVRSVCSRSIFPVAGSKPAEGMYIISLVFVV